MPDILQTLDRFLMEGVEIGTAYTRTADALGVDRACVVDAHLARPLNWWVNVIGDKVAVADA